MPTGRVDLALRLFGPAVVLGFVAWSWFASARKRRSKASGGSVADGPRDAPYRAFTRSFRCSGV